MKGLPTTAMCLALLALCTPVATAQEKPVEKEEAPSVPGAEGLKPQAEPEEAMSTVRLIVTIAVLSVAPALLMLLTSFTRIVIVLSFLRRAFAAQDIPPGHVVTGLAVLLTIVVMAPTYSAIKKDALDPYTAEKEEDRISQDEALERAEYHARQFMFRYARVKDIRLFLGLRGDVPRQLTQADVPTDVLVPAFVISELRRAFIMGFAMFLPFLIIDMLVASGLLSLGMLFVPPVIVSLPFKVLLFILVDGWHLVIGSLLQSFEVEPLTGGVLGEAARTFRL